MIQQECEKNNSDVCILGEKPKRNLGVELLRIILMFMIVMYHVFSLNLKSLYSYESFYFTKLFFVNLGSIAVMCFVFISGYYKISSKIKQLISFVIQAVFFSYVISFISYLFSTDQKLGDFYTIDTLLPISSSLWWFLTNYILLYIFSPLLNIGVDTLPRKSLKIVLLVLLYLNCFSNFIYPDQVGGQFFNFMFVYLLGRYINKYDITLKKPLVSFISIILLMYIINVVLSKIVGNPIISASRYTSILNIFSGICLFFVFKNISVKGNFISKISPLCFGVYLIHFHPFVWNIIQVYVHDIHLNNFDKPAYIILILLGLSFIVFLSCLCIEKVRILICNPLINFIGKRLDKYNLNI